ncbi:3-keto-disaccharide hydrolase [Pirellulaceae bacterium SH501]
MHRSLSTLVLLSASIGLLPTPLQFTLSARAGETFVEPQKAGLLFDLQGEYLGVVEEWGGNWGAQVVANGPNKLTVHLLKDGLPGAGAKTSTPEKRIPVEIDQESKRATGALEGVRCNLQNGKLVLEKSEEGSSKKLGTLTRIIRESKTLGAQPPEGAVILWKDPSTNDFKGAKESDFGLGVGGSSQKVFGDHRLHIEFRTPFQPSDTGQARGNSGVYVQGRYEVQVLDSFGLTGADNECGGIYQKAKPAINMCFPPLSWQTYDIQFTAARYDEKGKKSKNARIRIEHNGIVIHEDLELVGGTPGNMPEGPTKGPLFLQDHGNPVAYRNIWVVPMND